MGIEQSVIQHCAHTLAGMKAAGLFNFFYEGKEEIKKELDWLNGMLNPRGVWVQALLWKESTVLVYVYRKKQIEASLSQRDVQILSLLKCFVQYFLAPSHRYRLVVHRLS